MYNFMAAVEAGGSILGDSLMTGLTLLVVVFAALVALSLVIQLFGKVGTSEKQPVKQAATPAPTVKKAAVVSAPTPVASVAAEDEDEVAAVIAAAVAMMAPAGVTYRVRRITPVGSRARSEWATAAVQQNTMPF